MLRTAYAFIMEYCSKAEVSLRGLRIILKNAGKIADEKLKALVDWVRGKPEYYNKIEAEGLELLQEEAELADKGLHDKVDDVLEEKGGKLAEEETLGPDDVEAAIEEAGILGNNSLHPNIKKYIMDVLRDKGISLDEFNALRLKDISKLTQKEKQLLKTIRESIPTPDEDTLMQKVIPSGDIEKYMDGTYQGVRGFVARAEHVEHLETYDDIFKSLCLKYPGSAYDPVKDKTLGVIRFKTSEIEDISIPYGKEMGGSEVGDPPFTGNGFTGSVNGEIVPEYKFESATAILDGAELWEISKDGGKELKAIYIKKKGGFIDPKEANR